MALYSELYFACAIKDDAPQQVLDLLRYLMSYQTAPNPQEIKPVGMILPQHRFFSMRGWETIFAGKSSNPFYGENFSSLIRSRNETRELYQITVRATVRERGEMFFLFLHWLAPYIGNYEGEGVIGFERSDVSWDRIGLIQVNKGEVYYVEVNLYADPVQVDKIKIDFGQSGVTE